MEKFIGNTLKDYLDAGRVELAIEAASYTVLCLTYMDVLPPTRIIFAILTCTFFGTLGVYSFNNVTDHYEDSVNKPNSAIISERKTGREILIFSLACQIVAIISACLISWSVLVVVCIIILGSFFYSYKSFGGGVRLKDVFIVKNATIALFWAFVPLLPMLAYKFSVPSAYLIVVFFVFTHDFISSMLSDMKDVEGDKKAGIKTFPSVYGVKTTLGILTSLNTLGFLAIVIGWMFLNLKMYLFLLPLLCISRYYMIWLIGSGKKSVAYVYNKFDIPTETSIGLLALIGLLFAR